VPQPQPSCAHPARRGCSGAKGLTEGAGDLGRGSGTCGRLTPARKGGASIRSVNAGMSSVKAGSIPPAEGPKVAPCPQLRSKTQPLGRQRWLSGRWVSRAADWWGPTQEATRPPRPLRARLIVDCTKADTSGLVEHTQAARGCRQRNSANWPRIFGRRGAIRLRKERAATVY
jgi:hypothetical protein